MAVPTLARAFALGALVATATPVAEEPQNATCGSGAECEENSLLQVARRVVQKEQSFAETCTGASTLKPYPYSQVTLWGINYPGWETCAGEMQTPINLKTPCRFGGPTVEKGDPLGAAYGPATTGPTLVNNGNSLEFKADWGMLTIPDATEWEAAQFHIHTPSEHTVNGKAAAAEMHIVNAPKGTSLLDAHESGGAGPFSVVGILFDVGRENSCLKQAFSELTKASCTRSLDNFDLQACFSEQLAGDYWFYSGSLTTPPCTEGLNWFVMKKRATVSKKQLKLLQSTYLNNARPVQPLNGREVVFHKVKSMR